MSINKVNVSIKSVTGYPEGGRGVIQWWTYKGYHVRAKEVPSYETVVSFVRM